MPHSGTTARYRQSMARKASGSRRSTRQLTWAQLAVRNAGFGMGMRALTWEFCWAVVREALGHEPTVDEVAEWWDESRRTAFREQVPFRKAFPPHKTHPPIS